MLVLVCPFSVSSKILCYIIRICCHYTIYLTSFAIMFELVQRIFILYALTTDTLQLLYTIVVEMS